MPTFTFTSPEGKSYTVEGPDGATRDQAFSLLSRQLSSGRAKADAPEKGVFEQVRDIHKADEARNVLTRAERGVTESVGAAGASLAGGAAAGVVGGVEGLARGAGAGIASLALGEGLGKAREAFTTEASDTIERRAAAMQPTPHSKTEERAIALAGKPFAAVEAGTDVLGQKTAELTHSPALGAGVKTAANVVLGKVVSGGFGRIGRAGRGTAPPQAPPGMTASGAPRAPMSDLGGGAAEVPRGTPPPQSPAGGAGAAQVPPATTTPPPPGPTVSGGTPGGPKGSPVSPEQTQRAQAYASSIGLDWTALGAGTRAALENIATDAGALERLNPAQVRRQALLQSQRIPVPATRSQITLDPVDARREAIAARTSEGGRIRDVDVRANAAIQGNLEALRGRVGGLKGGLHEAVDAEGNPAATPSIRRETGTPTQVGGAFQGALREKVKWSKKAYEALYKKAEAVEPDAPAGLKPVTDLLAENPDIQHIGWVQSWLSKARGAKARAGGVSPEEVDLSQVTLKELNDLRKVAVKNQSSGGTAGYYAGEVKRAVDAAMQDVPEGAKAWKAAIDAFQKHQAEFKDQGAVRRLVGNKKGGDRATSLEKTWRKVATGSVEEIRQIKRSALTGGTPQTRAAGRAAWRQVRAETVNRILEDARQVVATDETERSILTAVALNRSIKRIPRENLEEIIGKANTRELYGILRARRLTKGRTTESGTVPNILVLAEKLLKHVPAGHYAEGALRGAIKVGELGKGGREAARAVVTPLEEAGEQVAKTPAGRAARRKQLYQSIEGTGPTLGDLP